VADMFLTHILSWKSKLSHCHVLSPVGRYITSVSSLVLSWTSKL
jgi:hypothetical protein